MENPRWKIYTKVSENPTTRGYVEWLKPHKIAFIHTYLPFLSDHDAWLMPVPDTDAFSAFIRELEGV